MQRERNLLLFKRTYNKLSNSKKMEIDAGAIMLELGAQLKRERCESFSVKRIAEAANLSTKTIWKIESGESVNFESLVKYLMALGYKIELKSNLFS